MTYCTKRWQRWSHTCGGRAPTPAQATRRWARCLVGLWECLVELETPPRADQESVAEAPENAWEVLVTRWKAHNAQQVAEGQAPLSLEDFALRDRAS